MAGSDPRRSSRARTSHPTSSSSSSTSGRLERNNKAFIKSGTPQKSSPTGSLSSEPEDQASIQDSFSLRRRTRGQGDERGKGSNTRKLDDSDLVNGDHEVQEEDGAIRCICGYDDYPGPPPGENTKHGTKDQSLGRTNSEDIGDDAVGFFVQCDICKIWQHGACVGIMTEESSPDEYFCEQCRSDLHRRHTASNGQRYSHYLPLKRQSRTASRSTSLNKETHASPPEEKDAREARNIRTSTTTQTSKRRCTINSREAGYNEAEALRRAIEASREEALYDHSEIGSRRAKRGRSDSEEKQENAKRQRTSSRSVTPPHNRVIEDSDDDMPVARGGSSKLKSRNSGNERNNHRVEKVAKNGELERQRTDAANKRKGRAERRRGDGAEVTVPVSIAFVRSTETHADIDADSLKEMPVALRTTVTRAAAIPTNPTTSKTDPAKLPVQAVPPPTSELPLPSQPTPNTSATVAIPAVVKNDKKRSHKKKGRNQYTRDRDDDESPARSQSGDIQKEDGSIASNHKSNGEINTHTHKANSKAKGGMGSKVKMSEMKRRAAAMLDYISRKQLDMAGEATPEVSNPVKGLNSVGTSWSNDTNVQAANCAMNSAALTKAFSEQNSVEMMDSLTRRLVKWQQEYSV